MAEPIEMPFGLWVRICSVNHVLDGGPDHSMQMGNFYGKDMSRRAQRHNTVSCAKMA